MAPNQTFKAPDSFDGTGVFIGGGWHNLAEDRTMTLPPGDYSTVEAQGFTPVPTPVPTPGQKASPATDLPD